MNSSMLFRTAAVLFVGAVFTLVFLLDTSDARDRSRSGTYATDKGRTGSYSGNTSGNLREGLRRQQSVTTDKGKTYNRSATTQYDHKTGDFNKSVTGVDGSTRTMEGTASKGKRSGSYSTESGKSGTFDSTIEKNGDGTVTRNDSWTNQDGQTRSRSATTGYDKDTNTMTRSVTGAGGKTRDGSVTFNPE